MPSKLLTTALALCTLGYTDARISWTVSSWSVLHRAKFGFANHEGGYLLSHNLDCDNPELDADYREDGTGASIWLFEPHEGSTEIYTMYTTLPQEYCRKQALIASLDCSDPTPHFEHVELNGFYPDFNPDNAWKITKHPA